MRRSRIMMVLGLAIAVVGCSGPLTTREKGALAGGAIGAGTGAIIGSQTGHPGAGAAIGAGVGVVSGVIIGDAIQGAEQKRAEQAPPPPPAAVVTSPPSQVAVAPPPPAVGPGAPQLIWVPEWGMYVVEGRDVVYHDGSYYYYSGGRWYISRSHGGPWAVVGAPPPVLAKLPPGEFHRNLPPGLRKKGKVPPGHRR